MGPGFTSMAMCSCMLTRCGRLQPAASVPAMGAQTRGGAQTSPLGLDRRGPHWAETWCRGITAVLRRVLGGSRGPEDRGQGWVGGEVGGFSLEGGPVRWQCPLGSLPL